MPVSASNSNPFGFNKADSILSDKVFYQIGGRCRLYGSPSRGTIPAAEFGIGWKANLSAVILILKRVLKKSVKWFN